MSRLNYSQLGSPLFTFFIEILKIFSYDPTLIPDMIVFHDFIHGTIINQFVDEHFYIYFFLRKKNHCSQFIIFVDMLTCPAFFENLTSKLKSKKKLTSKALVYRDLCKPDIIFFGFFYFRLFFFWAIYCSRLAIENEAKRRGLLYSPYTSR